MNARKLMAVTAICVAAAMPSWADKTISENTTLTEDTDWRDQGVVTIAEGVTLNLNGYDTALGANAQLVLSGGYIENLGSNARFADVTIDKGQYSLAETFCADNGTVHLAGGVLLCPKGATQTIDSALNWRPWTLSVTHEPVAEISSPSHTACALPTTVISFSCLRAKPEGSSTWRTV